MADNTVTLVGTLGADPELRRTSQGKEVASFRLVTNTRVKNDDDTWSDGSASWFRVEAWNGLGRNAGMSFRKGQRVIVHGALKVDEWKAKDGGTGRTVVLTASALGHDLLWGTSSFVRAAAARTPVQQTPAQETRAIGWGAPAEPEAADPEAPDPVAPEAQARELQPAWSTPMGDDEVPF